MHENHSFDKKNRDPFQIILVILAVGLVFTGLVLLQTTPIDDTVVVPKAFWILLAGLVIFVLAQLYPPFLFFKKHVSMLENKGSFAWIIFAIFLASLAALAAYLFEVYGLNNFIPVVSIWLFGAFCYVIAFIQDQISLSNWKGWFQVHRGEIVTLTLIVLLAACLRFYNLGEFPRVIDGDEGRIGVFARGSVTGTLTNPFALWENIGALYMQAINVSISLFGSTPFALRLLPATAGTLAVVSIYLFAKQVSGSRKVAFLAALILAILHTHIHFSRTAAVSYIQGTWLIPLEMYFFLSGVEKRCSWRTALAGILLAIHMSIYLSAQIMLGVFAVFTILALIFLKDGFRGAWPQVLAFWGGFFITFIPEGSYMLRHSDEFLSRMNAEGTFNSGWLAQEIMLTGKSTAQILIERVFHAFLSLIYYPAIDFYGSPVPMLSLVSAFLFLLGMIYALINTRSLKFLLLNGYFWGATVAIGVFAIPPSADTYRMLVALPPAIIMIALALEQLLEKIGMSWQQKPVRHALIISTVLVSLLVYNIWTYYFDFLGRCRFGGDPQTRFASYLGNYVRSIESEADVYLLSNDTFRYGSHDSVNFLTKSRPIINFPEPLGNLTPVSGETIIASPARIEELRMWAREHPGGQLHFQYDCEKPMLLAYQIP